MQGRTFRSIAALLALLQLPIALPPAFAQEATPRIAVLELVGRGASAELLKRGTAAVRRALGENQHVRLAPSPAIKLRSMLLALGCQNLEVCLPKIGKQLEVQLVLTGEIEKTAKGYRIVLRVFDVAKGRTVRTEEHTAADEDAAERAIADAALLTIGEQLSLTVESDVEGAVIVVNGQPLGTTPATLTEGLKPGTNEVLVRARGKPDFKSRVVIRPGKPLKLYAGMGGGTSLARKPDDRTSETERPIYKKWWFWTLVGTAVVGAATAAIVIRNKNDRAPAVGVEF